VKISCFRFDELRLSARADLFRSGELRFGFSEACRTSGVKASLYLLGLFGVHWRTACQQVAARPIYEKSMT
jgi:hypothetical protein